MATPRPIRGAPTAAKITPKQLKAAIALQAATAPMRAQHARSTGKASGGAVSYGGSKPYFTTQTAFDLDRKDLYDNLTTKLIQREQEQQALETERVARHERGQSFTGPLDKQLEKAFNIPGIGGILKKVDEVVGGGLQLSDKGLAKSDTYFGTPLGRTLEGLNRVSGTITTGAHHAVEQAANREDARPEGEGPPANEMFRNIGDFLYGAGQSLGGYDIKSGGELYELAKNRSKSGIWDMLRWLEEKHPAIEQNIAVAAGTTAQLGLDPLNFVAPARGAILRETGQVARAETEAAATAARVRKQFGEHAYDVYANRQSTRPHAIQFSQEDFMAHGETNALDRLSESQLDIAGGGKRGYHRVMDDEYWAETVAQSGGNAAMDLWLRHVDDDAEWLWEQAQLKGKAKGKARKAVAREIEQRMAQNPDFAHYVEQIMEKKIADNKLVRGAPTEYFYSSLKPGDEAMAGALRKNVADTFYTHEADVLAKDLYRQTRNAHYSTGGIRVGNKFIPVKWTGRAYNKVLNTMKRSSEIAPQLNKLSYEKMAPGILSLRAQEARSLGAAAFEIRKKEIESWARQVTRDEEIALGNAIRSKNRNSLDPKLQPHFDFIEQQNRRMPAIEMLNGARAPTDPIMDGYMYPYYRKGSADEIKRFKGERKSTIHKTGKSGKVANEGAYGFKQAQEAGLDPEPGAYTALMARASKHQRDMVRAGLTNDFVESWGFLSPRLEPYAKHQRDAVAVDYNKLSAGLRDQIDKLGGPKTHAYYLPRMHHEFLEEFNKISRWNSHEWGLAWKRLDKIMRMVKKAQTVYKPGFQVGNVVGDTMMGLLDGVMPWHYEEYIRKNTLLKMGKNPMYKIAPGYEISLRELKEMYFMYGTGSFTHADLESLTIPSKRQLPRRFASGIDNAVSSFSEAREDIGRLPHFIHAFQEEARALIKKGVTDTAQVGLQARDSAIWRVNQYRFDYNAITLGEKKLKTLAVPFYTYTRKVMPILLSSLFENPKWMSQAYWFMRTHDGSGAENFSHWNLPSYLRMGGGAYLNDAREPLFASGRMLPMDKLNMLQPGGTLAPWNPDFWMGANQSIGQTVLSNLGIFGQLPIGLGTGVEPFKQKPFDDPFKYMMNLLPMWKDITEEGNQVPGLNRIIPGENKNWDPQSLIYNSLTGVGLPIRPLTMGQQEQTHNTWMDRLLEGPMGFTNRRQDFFSIGKINRPEDGVMQFRVTDNTTGEELIFPTLTDATNYVNRMVPEDYRRPSEFIEADPATGLGRIVRPG